MDTFLVTTNNLINNYTEPCCVICGDNHFYPECNLVKITNYVSDSEIPSKAKLTLPNFLRLELLVDGSYSVYTKELIKKGTRFGPYIAKRTEILSPSIMFPLKIFSNSKTIPEYYLDTTDENECSWMIFVAYADYIEDQNLICFQENTNLYYVAIKDIEVNTPLKVWYAPYYAKRMKKNVLTERPQEDTLKDIDINLLVKQQQKIVERKIWNCKFCSQIETDIVPFAVHIRKHYLAQLKNTCEFCHHTFYSNKALKKHLKNVHYSLVSPPNSENKPVKPLTKIKDSAVGGPLLNDLFSDSLDNSNLILQQTDLNQFDINNIDNQNLFLDTDDNLNVENLLNETFNFEIDVVQKQFLCDICLKQFSKLRLLILHLKYHTGDHICYKCLKIFCRKENLLTHSCNITTRIQCNLCEKTFIQRKYYIRHLNSVHEKKFKCVNCNKYYYSNKELADHNCCKVSLAEKNKFICSICNKIFYRLLYLKRHMKTHNAKTESAKKYSGICEICGLYLSSKNSHYLHKKKHGEPTFSCEICDKKFYRKDVLNVHLAVHNSNSETFECTVCKKKLKSKKILHAHLRLHNMEKLHQCSECDARFKHRSSLVAHTNKQHNSEKNKFSNENNFYECSVCLKAMKLKSSLLRHMKNKHPQVEFNINGIVPILNENYKTNNTTNKVNNEQKSSNEIAIKPLVQSNSETLFDISLTSNIGNGLDMNLDNILRTTNDNLEIENLMDQTSEKKVEEVKALSNEIDKVDTEICLSIPDLTEADQEITLGKNAYILENGTIVQPQENSDKVVIYVLNEAFSLNK